MSGFEDFDIGDIINSSTNQVEVDVPKIERDGWYGPMVVPYGNDMVFTCYEYAPKHIVLGIIYQGSRHTYAVANDRWVVKGWDDLDNTAYEVNVYGKMNAAKVLEKWCRQQVKVEPVQ